MASSPDVACVPSTAKHARPSAPTPEQEDCSGRRYAERRLRASREFMAVLLKGSTLPKIRDALCWASREWPDDPALSSDDLGLMYTYRGPSRTEIAARWRKVLLDAALTYESLE